MEDTQEEAIINMKLFLMNVNTMFERESIP